MSELEYKLTKTPFDVLSFVKSGKVLVVDNQESVLFNPLEDMGNVVFGVTGNENVASKMFENGFNNVFHFDSVNIDMLFHDNEFDTIIVDGGLHEIFTRYRNSNYSDKLEFNRKAGGKNMVKFLVKAYDKLKTGGKLIIRDYSLPDIEYEKDNILIKRDKDFENYLQGYLENEMNRSLWANKSYSKTLDENLDNIIFNIDELINVFASIIEGFSDSPSKEFAFLPLRSILKYVELAGFEDIKYEAYTDERLLVLASHLHYKNASREQNILPDTNFIMIATK